MTSRIRKHQQDPDGPPDSADTGDRPLARSVADLDAADPGAFVLSGIILTGVAGATAFRLWRSKGPAAPAQAPPGGRANR